MRRVDATRSPGARSPRPRATSGVSSFGSHDADRVNKEEMPDHFFNWWTHSGKGLIAGPSGETYAEEQFAEAKRLWLRRPRAPTSIAINPALMTTTAARAPGSQSG